MLAIFVAGMQKGITLTMGIASQQHMEKMTHLFLPIFIAAGEGLKHGFETERIIRQIDFAATVAALGGVRMPAQCEGAPVYQIFEEEF